ncbi:unnamed protein product [Coregonus sp. 'balchen']|nr:unnamed protein product [Coregonus sp. 'balchen']
MANKKAVLFNLWGVVVSPRPAEVLLKFEETHKLPRGFLEKVMIPELDAECVSAASDQKVSLPAGFSVKSLLEEFRDSTTVNKHILQTVATLRRQGLLTGVLANQWVDDSGCGDSSGRLLSLLGGHFDVVLQSCRTGLRVPETDLFTSALTQLGVPPEQALWLADDEEGVGAAEAVGMTAVLVKDLPEALKQVETFTGVQVVTGESYPASCNPEEVSHGYITIKIPALADAGFRVLSLDMKGYGESTAPQDIEEYSQEQICQDLVTFMDKMGIPQVTLVGHDWGGAVVWNMARCGLFVGLPEEMPRSSILSETALQFYITQFKDKGFRGPLNWYRNVVSNWKWLCSRPRAKLLMPALMVTAGKDPVLLPVFSKGMENMIPNLTRGHIEECGHWTQMERPSELNTILISWLKDTHYNTGVAMTPKL